MMGAGSCSLYQEYPPASSCSPSTAMTSQNEIFPLDLMATRHAGSFSNGSQTLMGTGRGDGRFPNRNEAAAKPSGGTLS